MNDRSQWATGIAFGGLIALAAAMGIGRFVYTPILPFMVDSLGLTKAEGGLMRIFSDISSAPSRLRRRGCPAGGALGSSPRWRSAA